jgi:hypothetical protein
MLARVGWFVALWCMGVVAVTAVSLTIRWALL